MNTDTKRHIDSARQVLVGVVPNPTSQIDQITYALIYKFMDDMDQSAIKQGDEPSFFVGDLEGYAWTRLMDTRLGNQERMNLYNEALTKFSQAKQLPELFRGIFKSAFLPYRSPETLGLFLKEINYFDYSHPEELGNAYEYLLSIMSSQGDAGQFRTPRHIIDFIVDVVNPTKDDKVLDPACGTGGFLVSSYKHILEQHDGKDDPKKKEKPLTPDERKKLMENFEGYDIDPTMARIAQVNLYLHQFKNPKIFQYDTLSNDEHWNDKFDVILANPPFMSPKGGIKPHSKFSIQSSRSEVLFVDYIMNHLRPKGRAGIIVPEGIIFQSGTAHKNLRKNLVEDGLYAVVSLPSGVFAPYSGVKTSILLFDNELAKVSQEILFVDIKDTGVSLGATQRAIEKNDLIPAKTEISKFKSGNMVESSRLAFTASKSEIISLDYDLSLSKYRKKTALDTEIPFVDLLEICKIVKGKSSSTKTKSGSYPLYLTAEDTKTADHFDFDGEGVAVPLISSTGHGRASIKRIHFVSGRFALANLLAFVEPLESHKLNARYLHHILDNAKDDMARLMNGAANVSMKTYDLEKFKIPLPPLEIQEQVVEQIDGYQKIIDGVRLAASAWKPRIEIDPEWEKVKLGEVLERASEQIDPQKKKGRVFYVGLENIESGSGRIIGSPLTKYEDIKSLKNVFHSGDLLYGKLRPNLNKVWLADRGGICSTDIIVFRGKEKSLTNFYWYLLLCDDFVNEVMAGIKGAQLPRVGFEHIKNIILPHPPLEIQKQIVEKIEFEQAKIEGAKELIPLYEQRIKDTIAKLWAK